MRYIAALVILLLNPIDIFSCTSAVVSGRATPDGRPILWKHRDSSCPRNALRHFKGDRYSFTGIVNADSTYSSQIWIGINEAGFSIMNTASYNLLSKQDYMGEMDREGLFMAEALGRCSTVSEFEEMLENTNGSRGVEANFGVIDAEGGAAFFEAGPLKFMKYDATDPGTVPAGYLIRTNFSFAGDSTKGYGYIRYRTISDLFMQEYFEKRNISVEFIIQGATRCLKHSLLELDLYDRPLPADSDDRRIIPFNDYIPRSSSVSSMVVQGVRPGEDPELAVMWTILGFPLVAPVFPLLNGTVDIPEILSTEMGETAPLNAHALRMKGRCFPVSIGSGHRYLDLAVLLNESGKGLLQQVLEIDRETIRETEDKLAGVRSKRYDKNSFNLLYRSVEKRMDMFFESN